jgi:hypothetical protein
MIKSHVNLYAPKGGQGVTTTAAMLAVSTPGHRLLVDGAERADLPSVLGCSVPGDWADRTGVCYDVYDQTATSSLGLVRGQPDLNLAGWDYEHLIVDTGTTPRPNNLGWWIMVLRPCYLAIRHAVAAKHRPDGIILINEPGRSLRRCDVEACVGAPVIAELDLSPVVARSVDAGMLAVRHDRDTARRLANIYAGKVTAL